MTPREALRAALLDAVTALETERQAGRAIGWSWVVEKARAALDADTAAGPDPRDALSAPLRSILAPRCTSCFNQLERCALCTPAT